jgi:Bax protein
MNHESDTREREADDRSGLLERIPERWAGEGAAFLALAALALYAVVAPGPATLPDFSDFERAEARKTAFFEFLAPIVIAENARIVEQRERLEAIAPKVDDDEPLARFDRHWMRKLAAEYELEWPGESRERTLERLLERVDIVPVALALVQAAKESGWGRSRFARLGNNLFGHWCYERGCGIVPAQRGEEAAHEVAAFDSVRQSVRRYINNLNTHPSYRPLRRIRSAEREAGAEPRALTLADGLVRYSQRREAYVEEIKQMIRANRDLITASSAAAGAERVASTGMTDQATED